MKIISVFNNKGGVGKTTLTYHFAHILAEMGNKILLIDMDAQSNLSLLSMDEEELGKIWQAEDDIIDNGIESVGYDVIESLLEKSRTIHFLLKSVEEGYSEFSKLPPLTRLAENLDFIPGRLTLFSYEEKISERWAGLYLGESLSLRTVTRIREIAKQYSQENNYDFVIIDTSPNLNALNKVIISMADGFIIPCLPDIFSLYGIKNIGRALDSWYREFNVLNQVLSADKKKNLPDNFVKFIGYVIYNAKRRSDAKNNLKIAQAHYNHASKIPKYVNTYIDSSIKEGLADNLIEEPIGDMSILYTHNTLPSMAQKHHCPMWRLPNLDELGKEDKNTIMSNKDSYINTKQQYEKFAQSFLDRMSILYHV